MTGGAPSSQHPWEILGGVRSEGIGRCPARLGLENTGRYVAFEPFRALNRQGREFMASAVLDCRRPVEWVPSWGGGCAVRPAAKTRHGEIRDLACLLALDWPGCNGVVSVRPPERFGDVSPCETGAEGRNNMALVFGRLSEAAPYPNCRQGER
jgi:hypothetical protein